MASNDLQYLNDRINQLTAIVDSLRRGAKGVGPLIARIRDIDQLADEPGPAFTLIDFFGTVSSSSITQPTVNPVSIPQDRDFWWWGMVGYTDNPGASLSDIVLITFNINYDGKRDLFLTDQNMASLVDTVGTTRAIMNPWGGQKFRRGSTVKLTFKRAAGFSNATRNVGVVMLGDLLP